MIERPLGYESEKNDCTIRALSLSGNIPYEKVHNAFTLIGRKKGHRVYTKKLIQKVWK